MGLTQSTFSRQDTLYLKGIGIILLLLHHLIGSNPGIPQNVFQAPFSSSVGSASKVCVALFMILSGYGVTEGSKKKHREPFSLCIPTFEKALPAFLSTFCPAYKNVRIALWSCNHNPIMQMNAYYSKKCYNTSLFFERNL